jgi:hypothetical protein
MVWSGVYHVVPHRLVELLGINGSNENLLVTAIFGIVKLVAAIICAFFLLGMIGRKRALLLGITC